ncbi:hypothetical protein BDW66DRAFT_166095 [Aspergillus desertorum]
MPSQYPEPIAIVGSGCRFPGGANSPSELWKLLQQPRDVCQAIPPDRFDTTAFYHPDGSHHGTTNVQHAYLLHEDLKQRLLLETVYEALEAGGHTIEALRGSDTGVYVGTMGVDYNDTLLRDLSTIPTYFATGTNRAIISNRVSYFFDWHGPSMAIDTACSSSLIAVHQAVQALRSGESRVAVACGTQVILGPEVFIFESKMKMLSPTGRSRMWDADADGYARGEGVAAVVLKRLSDAISDEDHIECSIRGTGANQDGYSNGITVPSAEAQAALIRQTYTRSGLDPQNPLHRPQFFEAHGTGTKAGDPKEAAVIHQSFGQRGAEDTPLYVGSVKTVIGHTEGAAGLAGLLKVSGAIHNGIIPPNMLFNRLNPSIEPSPGLSYQKGSPDVLVSTASVSFGGSNAHAILEEYKPATNESTPTTQAQSTPSTPYIFSAISDVSLANQLQAYSEYLKACPNLNPFHLAHTLQSRRSQLPVRAAFSAFTIDQLTPGAVVGIRATTKQNLHHILGVFTGQGAQWAAMGACLIRSSDYVRKRVRELQESLATLPLADRPEWNLHEEMLAGAEASRISEAALSQPLSAGITLDVVVGFFSAHDAIRIAYYRGLYARMAGNPTTNQKGSMLAVGTSLEDAQDLTRLSAFKASVTLSGDVDAVLLAKKVFDEEKKFARLLKVDTAYHSPHMLPCGDPYIRSLKSCSWFSSVTPSHKEMEPDEKLQHIYWFKHAIGPHPALRGPAMQNIADVQPSPLPYTGLLSRGKDDVEAFSDALGFLWTHLGGSRIDFQSFETTVSGRASPPKLVTGLPSYRWNHNRRYWHESRRSRKMRGRKQAFHEILGVLSPDSTPRDMRWTNVLKVSEIPWLAGHKLQNQTVFPAAAYVAMAFEAIRSLAPNKMIQSLELQNLSIPRAITFEEDENTGVKTLTTLTAITSSDAATTADFSCYSSPTSAIDQEMELMAAGSVKVVFAPLDEYNISLATLGYGYYGPFRGMTSLKRRLNKSSVMVDTYTYTDADTSVYVVHPTMLDVAFQAAMLAYSAPEDERLWIQVNPELCFSLPTSGSRLPASIDILDQDGKHAMIRVEDLTIKPFAPATEKEDRHLFSKIKFDIESPDGASVVSATVCERISYYYWTNGQPHHLRLRDFVNHTLEMKEWSEDTEGEIEALIHRQVDVKLISVVDNYLGNMLPNNMLDDFYKKGLGFERYNSFLAGTMKQIVHRYPHARILEIGAGTGGATKSIFECIGTSFSTYTYTDVSEYSSQMTFQVLDIEKSPSDQGYDLHSYDIVVASNHTRQLLKPGGYLINIMGGLPGWWLGADDGRRYAPTTGFGGIDTITPEIDTMSWPLSIIVSQAVDDRSSSPAAIYIESLVILGNKSLETSRIAEELEDHLSDRCGRITILSSLPSEDDALRLPPMSVFINLVDIESPIFKNMTAEKMNGLNRMYDLAKQILWVTVGAQGDEPYHMASISFNRAMSHEAGHICLTNLDLSDLALNVSKFIAECVLRQAALDEWGVSRGSQNHNQILWSKEPELFFNRGQLMIPRLISNPDQNARINATRRVITKDVRDLSSNIAITSSANSNFALVEQILPVLVQDMESQVRVEKSTLTALRVASDTFLFLGIGKAGTTEETVLALSSLNCNRMVPLASISAPTSLSADQVLGAVASELLSSSLLETISSGCSFVVHCSNRDFSLISSLSRRAAAKGIRMTIAIDNDPYDDNAGEPSWLNVNKRMPRQVLRQLLQSANATHYLDLTRGVSELSHNIAAVLPLEHKRIMLTDLFRDRSLLSCDSIELVRRLEEAVKNVSDAPDARVQDLAFHINEVPGDPPRDTRIYIVNWKPASKVTIKVRPLDARHLFTNDKTYVLFGLSGQIGQSLIRNPNVDKDWLKSFEAKKAIVKIYSMDITDKLALERVVNDIRATCPPIAGIANGAMVLKDTLFSKMSAETMQAVLGPKIDGTRNLDEVFYHDALDFFILFSSSACVIGNSGQSNYAAANGYLNGIAKQRRKRGLAASAMDIGRVAGIGYVETAGQAVMQQLTRFGLMAINEPELHQMFAETILAGYPKPEDKTGIPDAVVTTGIRTISDDEDIQGPWFDNPLFSHCIVLSSGVQSATESQDKKASLPIAEQLKTASTMEQALAIVQDCFTAKLRVILQLADQAIDYDAPLVELGLDSLVAVEVRSWFLKELKVDIPVLKVVGGASLGDLCKQALDKLPEDFIPCVGRPTGMPTLTGGSLLRLPGPRVADSSASPNSNSTPASITSGNDGDETPPSSIQSSSISRSYENLPELVETKIKAIPTRSLLKRELISLGQSRFWFLRYLLDDQTTSNVAFYYRITGNLRIGDLERAVRVVTSRHEALRTCFVEDETQPDQAYQNVMNSSPLRLERKNIQSPDDVRAEYAKIKKYPFDLENGDLMRLVLLSLSPTSHYLLVSYHHILMDGVSFQVFLSELEKAYSGDSLGPSPQQFPSFSMAQRASLEAGDMKEELSYWQRVFPIGKQPPVLPLLPMARISTRVPMVNYDVHQVRYRLEPALAAQIKSISKKQRSTPFHFYLAAFKTMLFRLTDASDLTIGIADANRTSDALMGSIGFFLNLLALRFARQTDQTFKDSIIEARNTTYAALANSRLPFDVLLNEFNVARSSSHSPFFQAFFDYRQGAQEKHNWGNTQFEFQEIHPGRTSYDITLDITDNATDALIMLRAQKSLYDLTAVNLLLDTYVHFLQTLSTDESMRLQDTPLFGEKQLTKAVLIGRGPNLESEWPTLPHRIDQVAQQHPNDIALVDGINQDLTYSDMISRIEAIAEALQSAGMGPGSRIMVFQTAASDWVWSMLAIMRIGSIYVPLDLRNPMPRLSTVAVDCEPGAILADHTTIEDAQLLAVPSALTINVSSLRRTPKIHVPNCAQADSPAAILYTSGSTGVPKGIVVTHSGLQNEIEGYTKVWRLGAERTLQQSAFTFNHASDQIYTGLVNGGTVYIVPWNQRGDPLEITKIIKEKSITYTKATPSEYSLWMQFGGDNLSQATTWSHAFGGGEPLTSVITQQFADLKLPSLRVYNSYGPTEISISSTKMEIDYRDTGKMADGRIPCGYSLPNYHVYVVDEQLNPLPAGMPGEICIGGAGVALGYLNKELTDNHFIANRFVTREDVSRKWTRMYRTGDIGHLQDDGAMIKIRGIRIEISDIESNIISTAKGVLKEAVVTLREGDPDFLVAHVVFQRALPIPQYMIPVMAVPLESLPLTNHSKVDRKALKALPLPRQISAFQNHEELTDTMVQLRQVWQDVLGTSGLHFDITPSTSFFLVGGNSLLVIRLQQYIRHTFNVVIRLVELLGASKLCEMARMIEERIKIEVIDWEKETSLPAVPDFFGGPRESFAERGNPRTLLVTGATGNIAKSLVPELASNPNVQTIYCVAVRGKQSRDPLEIYHSSKIVSYDGDLTDPLLGLSENDFHFLSSTVDAILHMGAQRSFWDNYHALQPANVHPTRELVKLAAPRRIPIHYISTIGVLPQEAGDDAVSAACHVPPVDGTNGYVASRWASERVLERAAERLDIPVSIYRFVPSLQHSAPQEVLDEFVRFIDVSGVMPDMSDWEGRIDMSPARQITEWLSESVLGDTSANAIRFEHYQSRVAVDVGVLRDHLEQRRGGKGLNRMSGLQWIGRIKTLGFGYVLTGQEATVGKGHEGPRYESRR